MAGKIDKLSGPCVITGASSGSGLELTKLAARDGCDLILAADRDLGAAEATARPSPSSCASAARASRVTQS